MHPTLLPEQLAFTRTSTPAGSDDIRLQANECGGIFSMDLDERFSGTQIKVSRGVSGEAQHTSDKYARPATPVPRALGAANAG